MKIFKILIPTSLVFILISYVLRSMGYDSVLLNPELGIVVLELTLVTRLILIIRKLRKNYRPDESIFPIDVWKQAVGQSIGKNRLIEFLASELILIYYSTIGIFKSIPDYKHRTFGYTKKSNYRYILGIIIVLSMIEIPLIHLLLERVNPILAWIFTGLSIYGFFWVFGDYQLMRHHPILLGEERLFFRIGIRHKLDLPLENITSIKLGKPEDQEGSVKLTPDNKVNITLLLHKCMEIEGLFGIKQDTSVLTLKVDDSENFIYHTKRKLGVKKVENKIIQPDFE